MGGGGKSGGGSSSDSAGQAAQTLADISKGLYEEGSAVRGQTQDMTSKILSGQYSPRVLPAYAPLFAEGKKGLEAQYGTAQDKIMSNTPAGGQLYSALADLESKRASSVGSLGSQLTSGLVSDIINRGTGAAYGSLNATTSGLGSSGAISSNLAAQEAQSESGLGMGIGQLVGNLGMAGLMAGPGSAGAALCCFIFIAAQGELDPVVRRYRDEHMTVRNRRGYCWLADRLVPAMKANPIVHRAVEWFMVRPMISYGRFHYGLNRIGALFVPIAAGWLMLFDLLGRRPPYQRRGTREVV